MRRPKFKKKPLRLLPLLVVLLLILAAVGHVVYWYLPRERPARPAAEDLPGRLLAAGGSYGAVIWLPYPHQNLAVFEESVGDAGQWLSAVGRWVESDDEEEEGGGGALGDAVAWPGFGPFRAPPARELAAAMGEDGIEVLAARVYPALAAVARLAGRVAGNPWLAGGAVEVDGRPATVTWDGTLWTVTRDGASVPSGDEGAAGFETGEALAAVRLDEPAGDAFPAGLYALRRSGDALTLTTEGAEAGAPVWPDEVEMESVSLALLRGPAVVDDDEAPAVLLLFEGMDGGLLSLPGAAVLYPESLGEVGRGGRLKLPHERLPSMLRRTLDLPEGAAGGLRVVASGPSPLAAAEALAPELAPRLTLRGTAPVLALWLDPEPTLALLDQVVDALESIPFVSRDDVRRWRDARTVLRPLARFERLRIEVLSGGRFRLVAEPGADVVENP